MILPFVLVLLMLALLPVVMPHTWDRPAARAALLFVPCALSLTMLAAAGWHRAAMMVGHTLTDYFAFMALISSLYGVAAGIVIEGGPRGGPLGNTLWLALGALLASFVGTTGASMLLVRPYVAAQRGRRHTLHAVPFFIFTVANVGGMLLPLGDPPLFLGYLRGVPFFWTWRLWPLWASVLSMLLALFYVIDRFFFTLEQKHHDKLTKPRLKWSGGHNVLMFAALLVIVVAAPALELGPIGQGALMLTVLLASFCTTKKDIYRRNKATIQPLLEVATVFLALFVTMPEALAFLTAQAAHVGSLGSDSYFWLTGLLSAVLDNAPCYLSMATLLQAQCGLVGPSLAPLAARSEASALLEAIASGAVALGAMTYIGNGPNLMVRAVAQEANIRVPSFFGYILWSVGLLLPVLACARWLIAR